MTLTLFPIEPGTLLVAGSRSITNPDIVTAMIGLGLLELPHPTRLIHGDAVGVDQLAGRWGHLNDIPVKAYPADWAKHGRKAGHLRNAQMVKECDYGIVIWDGESKGTKDTLDRLGRSGKPYWHVILTPSVSVSGHLDSSG